jgi:hypothetical protein
MKSDFDDLSYLSDADKLVQWEDVSQIVYNSLARSCLLRIQAPAQFVWKNQ